MDVKELFNKRQILFNELMEKKTGIDDEKRTPTLEERDWAKNRVAEITALDEEIDIAKTNEEIEEVERRMKEATKEPVKTQVKRLADVREFKSLGEQARAVFLSERGSVVDPRLLSINRRAASGMGEAVAADGGFFLQDTFSEELLKRTYARAVVASRARRIPIGPNSNNLKINAIAETSRANGSRYGGVLGYWLAEAGTKTASKPTVRQIELTLKKLIGLCYATDELLQDVTALGGIIQDAFTDEFGYMLDDACINGTGAAQPLGVMNSGARVQVTRNTAASVLSEDIINMWARMWAPSRSNAVWFINQDVEPQLYQMSLAVGTAGGQLTYMPPGGLSNAPYATLMGRPVIPIEQCQTMGTSGDIILADMNQYIMIERGGMDTAISMHYRFVNDESTFRFVLRVDGQPWWNSALTPAKGSNTQSPFIVLS